MPCLPAPAKRKADPPAAPAKRQKVAVQSVGVSGPVVPVVQDLSPIGLIWDSRNYSCGYDTLLTIITSVWMNNPLEWHGILKRDYPFLGLWADALVHSHTMGLIPEYSRDYVRQHLHATQPMDFPYGPRFISMDALMMATTSRTSYGQSRRICSRCGFVPAGFTDTLSQYMHLSIRRSIQVEHPEGLTIQDWFQDQLDGYHGKCQHCSTPNAPVKTRRLTVVRNVPDRS